MIYGGLEIQMLDPICGMHDEPGRGCMSGIDLALVNEKMHSVTYMLRVNCGLTFDLQ